MVRQLISISFKYCQDIKLFIYFQSLHSQISCQISTFLGVKLDQLEVQFVLKKLRFCPLLKGFVKLSKLLRLFTKRKGG